MSTAYLIATTARELRAAGGRYALATLCIGVGQGSQEISSLAGVS